VVAFTGLCIQQGLPAFSPIAYFHSFARLMKLPGDAEFWHATNMEFLRHSSAVFLLHLPGWDTSKGCQTEINVAKILCIPVQHFGPDFKEMQ
jgi:hypothetical protein